MARSAARLSLVLLSCLAVLAACGSRASVAATGRELPVIRVYLFGSAPRDMDMVASAVNDLARKDLGATVEWSFLGWDRWDQKYALALASGAPISAIYTATWANYQILAAKGSFLPLDNLLPTYAPKTWKALSAAQWSDARVNGTIYTVPCDWKEYVTNCITYRADIARALGFTSPLSSIADVEAFIDRARQATPGLVPFGTTTNDLMAIQDAFRGSYDKPIEGTVLSYLVMVDRAGRLVTWFETPEFLRYALTMKRWGDKGYWADDVLTSTTTSETWFRQGQNVVCVENPSKADAMFRAVSASHPSWDLGAFVFAFANGYVHANPSIGNGMALPRRSTDAELTLAFLDRLHSDSRYYRLTTYGIEGVHYKVDPAGRAVTVPDTGFGYEAMQPWGWHVDALTLHFRDTWPQYAPINDALAKIATPGRYSTFAFDSTPVAAQVAALTQVANEHLNPLMVGKAADVPGAVRTMVAQMKEAGLAEYTSELRRQLDAYAVRREAGRGEGGGS